MNALLIGISLTIIAWAVAAIVTVAAKQIRTVNPREKSNKK